MKPGQVKMKDVAEQAGVSLMAVSLALRDDGSSNRVGPETREKILRIARELSYSPNARARTLRSGVTNVLGLYAGYGYVNVRLPFFTEVVSGLQDGCEKFGKDLLLHGTFRKRSTHEIYAELRDGRIDGLVVNMAPGDPLAALLSESHLPVVAIADTLPGIPSVVVDDAGGARLIAEHLAARGYRKCLYVDGGVAALSSTRRREGFLRRAPELSREIEEIDLTSTPGLERDWVKNWLERPPATRPDAIVCWNDTAAYDVLAQCRRLGVDVPGDVAVTGFDGCPTPYENFLTLSTVRAPWARAAQMAVEHLDSLIGGQSVEMETVLPVELIEGHTS